jgi:ABC-type transporter Mla subunit MlaD
MAEEIIFKTTVDTGNSVKDVEKLDETLKKVDNTNKQVNKSFQNSKNQLDSVLKSSDSFEDKLEQLNKVIKSTPTNVRDMNKQIQAYQSLALEAGRNSPIGRQALQQASELRDRYIDIQNETKRLADDQRNLKGVMELGQTILSGYGAFQGCNGFNWWRF